MVEKNSQNWTVKVSSKAAGYLNRLDPHTREKVTTELKALCLRENPIDHQNVKPLLGEFKGFYRLRIGKYRLIFSLLKDQRVIAVVNLVPRGDAY